MATTTGAPAVLSTSTMTGDSVKNSKGENLGEIQDLMIDTQSGRVAYAVLSFGGFFGMGDKLFAIPFNALEICPEEKCFKFEVDKEQLENAHGFDKNNWPDMADRKWQTDVHNAFKVDPYWM